MRCLLILSFIFQTQSTSAQILDETALQQLSTRGFYQTQYTFDHNSTVRGFSIQDISVPSALVWDCLLLDSGNVQRRNNKAVQVYDAQMTLGSWLHTWRGTVQYTYDPAHQTLTFQTTNNIEKKTRGTWRVDPSTSSSTRVSLVVDQTLASTRIPYVWFDSWVPSVLSKSMQSLIQCIQSPARQQSVLQSTTTMSSRKSKGLLLDRTNKHSKESLDDSSLPVTLIDPELSPVGLKRYGLVSTVFVLALYNVHLYFSQ